MRTLPVLKRLLPELGPNGQRRSRPFRMSSNKPTRRLFRIAMLALALMPVTGNSGRGQTPLRAYVREALENNIVLRQRNISAEKAMYALRIASSYWYPTVSFLGNYSSGEGGRNIALPVGTLLNPVYQTLNQLTGSGAFPRVNDVRQDFLPHNFYDVRLRTSVPLLNTDLHFNRAIQERGLRIAELDVKVYERELVKDVTVAYYNLAGAEAAVGIYDNAVRLAREAKRVNESLLLNGRGLPLYVLRSDAELEEVSARKSEAIHQVAQARRYFNFLLNRDQDAAVSTGDPADTSEIALPSPDVNASPAVAREELSIAGHAVQVNQALVDLHRYSWVPKVSAFLDLGLQDQWLTGSSRSRYYLVGLQVELPIFQAFRSDYQTASARLDLARSEDDLELLHHRLALGQSVAADNLSDAREQYQYACTQLETARRYNQMILRAYQEGAALFLETVDARTKLLNAELLKNINRYKVRTAQALYDREMCIQESWN